MNPPLQKNEAERLASLYDYAILDTPPEQAYDDIVWLAAQISRTSIAWISLLDSARLWFKAKTGFAIDEIPRHTSFCTHLVGYSEPLIVPDARVDSRFAQSAMVISPPHIHFYTGIALTRQNQTLGALCVASATPHKLTTEQLLALKILARQTELQLELRRQTIQLAEAQSSIEEYQHELATINTKLVIVAGTDQLTGLPNRAALQARMEEEFARAMRYNQRLSILLIDIDHLPAISDSHDPSASGEALRSAGQQIDKTVRTGDFVAHFSGGQFAILLPNTGVSGANIMAERLRRTIETTIAQTELPATVSIGAATLTILIDNIEKLLAAAHHALNHAKQSGRNRTAHANEISPPTSS